MGAASTAAGFCLPDHMIRAMRRCKSDVYLTNVELIVTYVSKTLAPFRHFFFSQMQDFISSYKDFCGFRSLIHFSGCSEK